MTRRRHANGALAPADRNARRTLRRYLEHRRRQAASSNQPDDGAEASHACAMRAEGLLTDLLGARAKAPVDLGRFLNRVATRQQMACSRIGCLFTSIEAVAMEPLPAHLLGAAMVEAMAFFDLFYADGSLDVYVAFGRSDDGLALAVCVRGMPDAVGRRCAHEALNRSRHLAEAVGGAFVRGLTAGDALIGVNIPVAGSETPAPDR